MVQFLKEEEMSESKRSKKVESEKLTVLCLSFYFLLFTFYFLVSHTLYAQEGEMVMPSAPVGEMGGLERPIVSEEYILMPGDRILISITGKAHFSYTSTLTYEGKVIINIPGPKLENAVPEPVVVDAILLYNLTLAQAADSLRNVFLKYSKGIDVKITLTGMRRFVVFVAGEVRNPGVIQAWPIDRVSHTIARAGNLSTYGSSSNIQLRRKGDTIVVNLTEFEKTGDTKYNPYVQDGDVIYVPRMEKSVIVRGAVFGKRGYELRVAELTAARERTSEGLYELLDGETVTDIVRKAGGVTPWADPEEVYIERGGKKINVNLAKALTGEEEFDIPMMDRDILIISSMNAVVYVQGEVVNPSSFAYQSNLRASDYIGLAGGPLSTADMGRAWLERGKEKISIRNNPIVELGDVIYVPRQMFKFWQDYVEIGSLIASLVISYLALR